MAIMSALALRNAPHMLHRVKFGRVSGQKEDLNQIGVGLGPFFHELGVVIPRIVGDQEDLRSLIMARDSLEESQI